MDPRRIREAREAHGLKQYELAAIAGISPSQMSRVEAGKRRLRLDEAEIISKKLNLNISEVIESRLTPAIAMKGYKTAVLPLPEGRASLEYPGELSTASREELKQWLELVARMVSRWL
jgi:transcriptional regulator with XRE-family HTH domain